MRIGRLDFEQKLLFEREAAAAAEQRIAAATADILHNEQRENFAAREAERSAAELRDVMSRVEAIQAQLPQVEKMSHECSLLQRRLALELQMLQVDAANADEEAQSSGSAAPPVAPQSSPALSHLPHDLVARVNAVLDKVLACYLNSFVKPFVVSGLGPPVDLCCDTPLQLQQLPMPEVATNIGELHQLLPYISSANVLQLQACDSSAYCFAVLFRTDVNPNPLHTARSSTFQ